MVKIAKTLGAALATAATLAGCGGGSDEAGPPVGDLAPSVVQPGAPGEGTRTLSAEELSRIAPPQHTAATCASCTG